MESRNFTELSLRYEGQRMEAELSKNRVDALLAAGRALPWSQTDEAQLRSIARMPNEDDVAQALLDFGIKLKSQRSWEKAAWVLGSLAQDTRVPAAVKTAAECEWNALVGKGSTGPRAEVLTGQFVQQATDAKMIVPMLGASILGQTVGAWALGRLVATPAAQWLTRGFGARFAAGSLGFAAEFPAFAGMNRAMNPTSPGPFADDWKRSALTLGALRVFHAFPSPPATFLGLMTAHKLEERFGLRPRVDGATAVTDTLAAMVSLGVGSHLGRRVLGPSFAAFQRELAIRSQNAKPSYSLPFARGTSRRTGDSMSPGKLRISDLIWGKMLRLAHNGALPPPNPLLVKEGGKSAPMLMAMMGPRDALAALKSPDIATRKKAANELWEIAESLPAEERLQFVLKAEKVLVRDAMVDRIYGVSPFHYSLYDLTATLEPADRLRFTQHMFARLDELAGDVKAQGLILVMRLFSLIPAADWISFVPGLVKKLDDPHGWVRRETFRALAMTIPSLPPPKRLAPLRKMLGLLIDADEDTQSVLPLIMRGIWNQVRPRDLRVLAEVVRPHLNSPHESIRRSAAEFYREINYHLLNAGIILVERKKTPEPGKIYWQSRKGARFLIENRKPVDYAEMVGNHRLVFFGEYHDQYSVREELMSQLPNLRSQGLTHLALEAFTSSDQDVLDSFQNGLIDRAGLREGMVARMESRGASMENPLLASYLNLVEAAKRADLQVVAMDLSNFGKMKVSDGEFGIAEIRERQNSELSFTNSDIELYSTVLYRNIHSAQILNEVLYRNPGSRILTLGGCAHYGHFDDFRNQTTLNHLMARFFGHSGRVVFLAGKPKAFEDPHFPIVTLARAADRMGLSGERFMIETGDDVAAPRPDYILHPGRGGRGQTPR